MTAASIRIIASDASWIDPVAVDQLRRSAELPGIEAVVGLPDLHPGSGIAVGAAFWSRTHVHPHLVGSDIGCGMGLWPTDQPLRNRPTGLVAVSQGQRSQHANRKIARLKLAMMLDERRRDAAAAGQRAGWDRNQSLERGNAVRSYTGERFVLRG